MRVVAIGSADHIFGSPDDAGYVVNRYAELQAAWLRRYAALLNNVQRNLRHAPIDDAKGFGSAV